MTFSIETRLSSVEAEAVLSGLVRPPLPRFAPDPPDARPFCGSVADGAFKFQPVIKGRNGFRPVVVGRVAEGEGGAIVRGYTRLPIAAAVVMTIWMSATIFGAANQLPKYWRHNDLTGVVVVGLLPVVGAVLIGFGYYPERRKAMQLLSDAFPPK